MMVLPAYGMIFWSKMPFAPLQDLSPPVRGLHQMDNAQKLYG
jgi:hypothetical protein